MVENEWVDIRPKYEKKIKYWKSFFFTFRVIG